MADAAKSANSGTQLQVNGTEISVSPDFKKVVLNGVIVETAADGRLVITGPDGTVISKPTPAGDVMKDGTVYAGEVAGKSIYAAPADAGLIMSFNEAARYAAQLNREKYLGHDDWRVPTQAELNVLFQNREKGALKGTFNLTGSNPDGVYWSSTPSNDPDAWCQRLNDGFQVSIYRKYYLSVRCVR